MSETILQEILQEKSRELAAAESQVPLSTLQEQAKKVAPAVGFAKALQTKAPYGVIAEIKRASPSKGVFRADLDPVETASDFISAGATCLSVLTDEKFFQGSLEFLREIKAKHPSTPVLRKDFTTSVYHIWEARAAGADAILLIAAALDEMSLRELLVESFKAGMDVLLEVHNEEEMIFAYETICLVDMSQHSSAVLLGINNRDLNTFHTDIAVSKGLLKQLHLLREARGDVSSILTVSESGIRNANDLVELSKAGAQSFLIGESLLASGSPKENLKHLLEEVTKLVGKDSQK